MCVFFYPLSFFSVFTFSSLGKVFLPVIRINLLPPYFRVSFMRSIQTAWSLEFREIIPSFGNAVTTRALSVWLTGTGRSTEKAATARGSRTEVSNADILRGSTQIYSRVFRRIDSMTRPIGRAHVRGPDTSAFRRRYEYVIVRADRKMKFAVSRYIRGKFCSETKRR